LDVKKIIGDDRKVYYKKIAKIEKEEEMHIDKMDFKLKDKPPMIF